MIEEPLRVGKIGLGGFFLLAHHVVELGEPHLHARVFGLHVEQPVQHLHGLRAPVGLQVGFGDLQEQRPRLAQHALLDVQVGQALERLEFVRCELGDLFVDRDGFAVETVVQVDLREPLEILDGLRHVALAREQIADGHQRGLIFRVVPKDLLIFADRLSDLALVEELQRVFERFAFVERHERFRMPHPPLALRRGVGSESGSALKVSTREKPGSMRLKRAWCRRG